MPEMLNAKTTADMLGVDKRTILRLARDGRIRSFRTPGGQHRFRREDVEKLAAGGGDERRPTVSTVDNKRDEVESLNLEMQARRAKRELARMEAEEAAIEREATEARRAETQERKLALAEARLRREQARESSEAAREREARERERHAWEGQIIVAVLAELPRDAPFEARTAAAEAVREALALFVPGDPTALIATATAGAVACALQPWQRSKAIQRIIEQAERTLPADARSCLVLTDIQIRFRSAADAAIRALPVDAALSHVRAVVHDEVRKFANEVECRNVEVQHRRGCARYLNFGECRVLDSDREAAREAIGNALAKLPMGCPDSEFHGAAERAVAPFEARKEIRRRAEDFLSYVGAYIEKVGGPDGEWELGDWFERQSLAERLKKKIRSELVEALTASAMDRQDAEDFIEDAVDSALDEEDECE